MHLPMATLSINQSIFEFTTDLTLKMASAQVVEMSVSNNSPSQDSNHPDDHSQSSQQLLLSMMAKDASYSMLLNLNCLWLHLLLNCHGSLSAFPHIITG